jgi:hypothetical protein
MQKPSTLEECFSSLKEMLSEEDLRALPQMTKNELSRLHHGLGRWIRNNWDLWQGGPLAEYFKTLGLHHPDDMSGLIIESFWHHLRNEPLDIVAQIKGYQDYWHKMGES